MHDTTLTEALANYFEDSGFDETTYTETWTRFKVGPVPVIFPNTAERKRIIQRHDLHHIATGYSTDIMGEGEQGAWELGSGCGTNATAWGLNLLAMTPGLVASPRRMLAAFRRGLRSKNLYAPDARVDMSVTVQQLREELTLDDAADDSGASNSGELLKFSGVAAGSLLMSAAALTMFPVMSLVGWTAYGLSNKRATASQA